MFTVRFFQIRLLVNICMRESRELINTSIISNVKSLWIFFLTIILIHLFDFINSDREVLAPLIDIIHQAKGQILERIWKKALQDYAFFLYKSWSNWWNHWKLMHDTSFSLNIGTWPFVYADKNKKITKSILPPDEHRQVSRRQHAFWLQRPAHRIQTSEERHSYKFRLSSRKHINIIRIYQESSTMFFSLNANQFLCYFPKSVNDYTQRYTCVYVCSGLSASWKKGRNVML